jgi:predicted aminopeptidase
MRLLISIPLLLLTCGCADFGYYWHNASGHLGIMQQRVDIETLLADAETDSILRSRLQLVQEIRAFSVERLDLPDNGSYSSYVQLPQPYVIQNLFAAPEFSTRLYQWCYPIIGCASYRGYYDETRLLAYVDELEAQGLEIYIGRIPAYSTLGWFDDPVLSSFIDWPDYRLAGLLFHELTHQRIYIDDDTTFNESLASAVQQVGTRLWLQMNQMLEAEQEFTRWLAYRAEVIALIAQTRAQLGDLYASGLPDVDKRAQKALQFQQARELHAVIAARYGITRGFTAWFAADLNNARIGSVAAYNSRVEAFVRMLAAHANDFSAFYAYVERLGELDRAERDSCLDAWQQDEVDTTPACPALRTSVIDDA